MSPHDTSAYLQRRQETLAQVRSVLIEQLHLPLEPEEIDPDVVLFGTGLALDSVDAMELIISLESHFGVEFPEQEAPRGSATDGTDASSDGGPDQASVRLSMRTVNTLIDAVLWLQDGAATAQTQGAIS